jgi:HAD superfamily hydrolase (TIGR01509 family)
VIKAALLDVDGTLVDSNGQHALAWSRALQEYEYDVSPNVIIRLVGMGADKILPQVDPQLSEKKEPGASIARLAGKIFQADYVSALQATPGARALLVELHVRGFIRVIATSAAMKDLKSTLEAAGLTGQFDAAATSDDADKSKPDADIVATALLKAGVQPSEAVLVGDTPYDVEAAKRTGVAAIALRCGGWSDSALRSAAAIFTDPEDLQRNLSISPFYSPASR